MEDYQKAHGFNLKKCRDILEADGEKYTDEEIQIIYEYLYEMAEISVSEYLKNNNITERGIGNNDNQLKDQV